MSGVRGAVFLDRDGVINRLLPGDYVKRWEEFEFLPGVVEAIRTIRETGRLVVVITNQQGVGKGIMDLDDLDLIHRRMADQLRLAGAPLDGVYACPHLAGDGCDCRKPNDGLIRRAVAELGIDAGASYMVGDSPSDLEAGRRAGCRPVLIGQASDDLPGIEAFPDLASFARFLAAGGGGA
jgi:histidinol-phosphate phosphatase family protein